MGTKTLMLFGLAAILDGLFYADWFSVLSESNKDIKALLLFCKIIFIH